MTLKKTRRFGPLKAIREYSKEIDPAAIFFNEPDGHVSLSKISLTLDQYQDSRAAFIVQDLDRSIGNYIADDDGNILLDMHNQTASISIGYNNPNLSKGGKKY